MAAGILERTGEGERGKKGVDFFSTRFGPHFGDLELKEVEHAGEHEH